MEGEDLVSQATREKVMSLARPGEGFGDVVARLADDAVVGNTARAADVYDAATRLVRRLDTVTTDEFAQGAERAERESLRSALVEITAVSPDDT